MQFWRIQDMGLHCDHAMAAIDSRSGDCRLYVEKFYQAATYIETYKAAVTPTLDRTQWAKGDAVVPQLIPPLYKISAGRPKKKRVESITRNEKHAQTVAKKATNKGDVQIVVYA